jgi:hypothetical protein
MPPRSKSRSKFALVALALLLGVAALWPDKPTWNEESPLPASAEVAKSTPADPPSGADPRIPALVARDPIGAAAPPGQGAIPTRSVRSPKGPRVRMRVHAPPNVKVGEVFQARVDFEAYGEIRELVFAVSYDKSRLALVGWSAGGFSQPGGLPAELIADEPSDGNIQVSLKVAKGRSVAGAGSMAVFEFEAIKAGTSGIDLRNVTALDGAGAVTNPIVGASHNGSVTVH